MQLAPIILFVYNRLDHTMKTIEKLKENYNAHNSDLFIFSDYPKNTDEIEKVNAVRTYINNIEGFNKVEVFESKINKGLALSIIDGVTEIIKEYGRVIVLEDDLITSKYFINYMNDMLDTFKDRQDIWSISGYTPKLNILNSYNDDIYLTKRGCSWGWATWKDRWDTIDWGITDYSLFRKDKEKIRCFNKYGNDMSLMLEEQMRGRMDSWAIRWCYAQFLQDKYTIYPKYSMISNIGNDLSGTHSKRTNKYDNDISNKPLIINSYIEEDERIIIEFKKFYDVNWIVYLALFIKKIGLYKEVRLLRNKIIKVLIK